MAVEGLCLSSRARKPSGGCLGVSGRSYVAVVDDLLDKVFALQPSWTSKNPEEMQARGRQELPGA